MTRRKLRALAKLIRAAATIPAHLGRYGSIADIQEQLRMLNDIKRERRE